MVNLIKKTELRLETTEHFPIISSQKITQNYVYFFMNEHTEDNNAYFKNIEVYMKQFKDMIVIGFNNIESNSEFMFNDKNQIYTFDLFAINFTIIPTEDYGYAEIKISASNPEIISATKTEF